MVLPLKSKSSDVIRPGKNGNGFAIGRGQPRSRSGNVSPQRYYKPVVTSCIPGSPNNSTVQSPDSPKYPKKCNVLIEESALTAGILGSDDQVANVARGPPFQNERCAAFDPRTLDGECGSCTPIFLEDSPSLSPIKNLPPEGFLGAAKSPVGLSRSIPADVTNIAEWGLPAKIVAGYRRIGITRMFPWQAECLQRGRVLQGGNLVYSAPTSAGKTLVAEILLLKRVIETKKKALFILPFVALAREKMITLQKMFKGTGIRVDGYIGHLRPAGGFALLDVAVCTIEKANSLINRLVDEKKLHQLGVIVVDELHMVGDFGRGYLIELLLTKVRYLNKIRQEVLSEEERLAEAIQIIGMSATLPNLDAAAKWLDADFFTTDFRPVPLYENVKLGTCIYNKNWIKQREVTVLPNSATDPDHIVSLCLETVSAGHSVLVFCPFKNWCESLAELVSQDFSKLGSEARSSIIQADKLEEIVEQLRQSPAGLDGVLRKTVPNVVAFHHAGLTMDEREIIEAGFRKCLIKVLIATTTLSSGVNLPARRVIIRSPTLHNNEPIDVLTYYQMAGRAGRKGVDTEGESILICKENQKPLVTKLFQSALRPVSSCLSSGTNGKISTSIIRAVLEIIVNGAARSITLVKKYIGCTLFATDLSETSLMETTKDVIDSLKRKELVFVGQEADSISPTQLGNAVVWSGLSPTEGYSVFQELEKARMQFNLENELHILYLVTPLNIIHHVSNLDWYHYLQLWDRLPVHWKRVGNLVGVDDGILVSGVKGRLAGGLDADGSRRVTSLRRFYCGALILNELAHEIPLSDVARKYDCNKGTVQSLQQGASTYAGIITIFCDELGWTNMALLFEQFQSRLMFGVQRELMELMKIQYLTARQARLLYQGGYPNLAKLATADKIKIQDILQNSAPFQSNLKELDAASRSKSGRNVILTGLDALSAIEAANVIMTEARRLLESEMEAAGFVLLSMKLDPEPNIDVTALAHTTTNRTIVELAEIQSSQVDVDQPLDEDLRVADDISKNSEATVILNAADSFAKPGEVEFDNVARKDGYSQSFNLRMSTKVAISPRGRKSREISPKKSPPKKSTVCPPPLDRSWSKDVHFKHDFAVMDAVGRKESSELLISSCSSTDSSPPASEPLVIKEYSLNSFLPSVLEPEYQNVFDGLNSAQFVTQAFEDGLPDHDTVVEKVLADIDSDRFGITPGLDSEQQHNHRSRYSGRTHDSSSTPVLFSSPGGSVKRKLSLDFLDGSPHKVIRRDSIDFNVQSKIQFEEDMDIVPSSLPPSPEPDEKFAACSRTNSLDTVDKMEVPLKRESPNVSTVVELPAHSIRELPPPAPFRRQSEEFAIVTVSVDDFNSFLLEWRRQTRFSLTLACDKIDKESGRRIGLVLHGRNPSENTNGLPVHLEKLMLVGISVSWSAKTAYYLSLTDQPQSGSNLVMNTVCAPLADRVEAVRSFFRTITNTTIIMFDAKRQLKVLALAFSLILEHGSFYDPKIADWMLNMGADEKSLQCLVTEHCPPDFDILDILRKHRGNGSLGLAIQSSISARIRSGTEAVATRILMEKLLMNLRTRDILRTFEEIEMRALSSIAGMELNGFGFSATEGRNLQNSIEIQLGEIEQNAHKTAGQKFQLTSPEACGRVLFVHLGLPPPPEAIQTRKTRGKSKCFYSTNKDILIKMQAMHLLPVLILEHRRLQHALANVVFPVLKAVVLNTSLQMHRIHGLCFMHSATGRVNMADPSLQTIPKDFAVTAWESLSQRSRSSLKRLGRGPTEKHQQNGLVSLRTAFIPFEGAVFFSADYSQLELRILAHLSGDDRLLSALSGSGDVFRLIASEWKGIGVDSVSEEERQQAKRICYGIIYGMGAKALAEQLDVTEAQSARFMETFKSTYPVMRAYLISVVEKCRKLGYIETLSGLRRYLPNISSQKMDLRSQAERQAVNTTVQGSAANLTKAALVKIDEELSRKFPGRVYHQLAESRRKVALRGAYLVLQLHDELVYEVCEDDLNVVAELVERNMRTAISLNVALQVKMKVGKNWGELRPFEL